MNIERFQKGGTWLTVRWQVPEEEIFDSLVCLMRRYSGDTLRLVAPSQGVHGYCGGKSYELTTGKRLPLGMQVAGLRNFEP